jgi:integrase
MATIERNIYLRKDGRYEARYASGKDITGRTRYSAVYARTLDEVKNKLQTALAVIMVLPGEQKVTIVQALEQHLSAESIRLKPSTVGVYSNYIKNYIEPFFKNMTVERLTQTILQDFVRHQIENGLSAVVVQSVFSFLKAGLSEKSKVFNVILPKIVKHKADFLTVMEQKRLETAARNYGGGTFLAIILCLYTGIRIGEVCGLQTEDIDFEKKTISVKRTIQRLKGNDSDHKTIITVLSPKSQTSCRVIPMPDFIAEALHKYNPQGFIVSDNDMPLEPRTLQYRFKRILKLAGVREVNFHTMRHSFAARALENGFDVKTLSEIMGHSSASITLSIYAHVSDECKRHHMESLIGVFDQNGDQMSFSGQNAF